MGLPDIHQTFSQEQNRTSGCQGLQIPIIKNATIWVGRVEERWTLPWIGRHWLGAYGTSQKQLDDSLILRRAH